MVTDAGIRRPPAAWWYSGGIALAALLVMAFEQAYYYGFEEPPGPMTLLLMGATTVAVSLYRLAPGAGLAVVWGLGVVHVIAEPEVMVGQLALAVLAYGVARYGSVVVLWSGVASVAAAAGIGMLLVPSGRLRASWWLESAMTMGQLGSSSVTILVAFAVLLVVPMLVGVALRMWDRARLSVTAMEQAQEQQVISREREQQAQQLAALREEQARLARDVHDVVGHSLTVILAQAQSAQFLDRDLQPEVAKAFDAISQTARSSLVDVRSILASTQESQHADPGAMVPPDFQRMIDDVRAAGVRLALDNQGQPRPLPPDQAVTLYRVLQEMLTNVLKHGRPGADVVVTIDWRAGLKVRVVNDAAGREGDAGQPHPEELDGAHRGIIGMRERMKAVGGTLDIERDGATFTVTAAFPPPGDRAVAHPLALDGRV